MSEVNNIPRGRMGVPRRAMRATLSIQITLLITEIWEEICSEGFESDSSETLVDLFVKHGLAEKVALDEEEADLHECDWKHRLKLDMAAVRFKAVKIRQKEEDENRRKRLDSV